MTNGEEAQRIPSWPGVIHSDKGRIHLADQPVTSLFACAKRRTIHSEWPVIRPKYTDNQSAPRGRQYSASEAGFTMRREKAPTQPIGNDFESGGRHCLFDFVVFAGCACLGVLQEMVHTRQFDDSCVRVVSQCVASSREIFLRGYLYVQRAVEDENRHCEPGQSGSGIVGENTAPKALYRLWLKSPPPLRRRYYRPHPSDECFGAVERGRLRWCRNNSVVEFFVENFAPCDVIVRRAVSFRGHCRLQHK